VALLVDWAKGPSWFTLHTYYDQRHEKISASAAPLSALCDSATTAQGSVETSGSIQGQAGGKSLTHIAPSAGVIK
jgi:hypothetical protein